MNNPERDRRRLIREKRRILAIGNAKYGFTLEPVPREDWPGCDTLTKRLAVWRSRLYLVQLFAVEQDEKMRRLTVNRSNLNEAGEWEEGITWDQLQEIKDACGFGDWWGHELYPPQHKVVRVSNMRHLWLSREAPNFGWK